MREMLEYLLRVEVILNSGSPPPPTFPNPFSILVLEYNNFLKPSPQGKWRWNFRVKAAIYVTSHNLVLSTELITECKLATVKSFLSWFSEGKPFVRARHRHGFYINLSPSFFFRITNRCVNTKATKKCFLVSLLQSVSFFFTTVWVVLFLVINYQ